MRTISTSELDVLLHPKDTEWREVKNIKLGDHVLWWTQRAQVIKNCEVADKWYLTVYDQVTSKEKTFIYKNTDELLVVKK